jgi:hypothetical protein
MEKKKSLKNTGIEQWWKDTGCEHGRSRRNFCRSDVPSTAKSTRTTMGSNQTSMVGSED